MGSFLMATVITYNPGNDFLDNIASYYHHVDRILIMDNSDFFPPDLKEKLAALEKIVLVENGQNLGIAACLNHAARYATEKGYSWLMTMDQDSSFSETQIAGYIHCFKNVSAAEVGVMAPSFETREGTARQDACEYELKDTVITSASIINLDVFRIAGPFNESLFIDGVDDEYCFSVNLKGFLVLQFSNVFFRHALGKEIIINHWLTGKNQRRSLHSPQRLYYMTRNYLFLNRKYRKSFPGKCKLNNRSLFTRAKNNLLFGPNKIKTLKMMLKGFYHYYTNKFGKQV